MSWIRRTVEHDGVRLACRDWPGQGPPLVLLHGLAGHAGEWDAIARALSPRHRVVAVDQRGQGDSSRHPGDVSRAAYVADVVAVAEHLRLHRPVVVGQSLGGHTALLAAAARPGLIGALVLVESGPGGPDPEVQARIGGWLDAWPVPFPSLRAAVEFFGGGAIGEAWAAGLERRAGGWWPRFDRDVMVASLAENARRSFWDDWTNVTCPTLAVWAQQGIVPPRDIDEMFRHRPELRALSVPGAGHDVHLEHPGLLSRAIRDFLDEVIGAGLLPA
ncbi:alpha/beta fold hydrolase [Streptomyces mexicanus]|uniref:alpha/beta fold hydrolase n=1 Tax=Streptomyces mexicanus TaxID=178566 RepID=UPI003665EABB